MKKILLACFISVLFASCSSDDQSSNTSVGDLPKKSIWSDGTTYNYFYQGNKLVKVVGTDGSVSNFTYTDDFITKIEYAGEDIFINRDELFYTNGELTQIKEFDGNVLFRKIDFSTIDASTKSIITTTYNNNSTSVTTYKQYYINNLLVKTDKLNSNGSVFSSSTYTYDNQNYLYKNITGYDRISNWYSEFGGPINNIKKIVSTWSNGLPSETTNYTYQYNSNGFPISLVISIPGLGNESVEFQYY